MIDATRKIDPGKVYEDDLAKMGGAPAEADEEASPCGSVRERGPLRCEDSPCRVVSRS